MPVGSTGVVRVSNPNQPEATFSEVEEQKRSRRRRTLQLNLADYRSPWANKRYDRQGQVSVWLRVQEVKGTERDFRYVGSRTVGNRAGDKEAALGQKPEWFEIHVVRTMNASGKTTSVVMTWKYLGNSH